MPATMMSVGHAGHDRQGQAGRYRKGSCGAQRGCVSGSAWRGRCADGKSVQTLEVIAWPDLGCEAVRRLTVKDMPLTVILDAHGGDLYQSGPAAYLEAK